MMLQTIGDLFVAYFLAPLAITMALMFLLWLLQQKTHNAGCVDIGWAAGLMIFVSFFFVGIDGVFVRKLIVLSMVCLWGSRLIVLLLGRLLSDKGEDARYQRLRKEWGKSVALNFFLLFQSQALLDAFLAIVFFLIMRNPAATLSPVEIFGILTWITGLVGEVLADEQLKDFKFNPKNKGKICQSGLWNYSRHPNYFFEWLMWAGYFILAVSAPYGWLAISAPVVMLHFLINVTGVPFTEAQSLKTRGEEYRRYQKTTSMFVPLPKRRLK